MERWINNQLQVVAKVVATEEAMVAIKHKHKQWQCPMEMGKY